MKACGFEGLLDTCTQDDFEVPEDASDKEDKKDKEAEKTEEDADQYHFICGYGEMGDYTWAVRIGGYGDVTGVVAIVAPTSHFDGQDLSDFDGSVCDYVAYTDLYTG